MRLGSWGLAILALQLLAPVTLAMASAPSVSSLQHHGAAGLASGRSCFGKRVTKLGTPGNDHLRGTAGPDVIAGLGGNDHIRGGGGNDVICGDAGRDSIAGGSGDDRLFGNARADRLWGQKGNDLLFGGSGGDRLFGNAGADRCKGGRGRDHPLRCEKGDVLRAGNVATSTDESTPMTIDVISASSDANRREIGVASLDVSNSVAAVRVISNHKAVRFDPVGGFDHLAPGQTAIDSFGYTLTDHHGHRSTAKVTVTIRGIDTPPAAVADTATMMEDQPQRIDVLANDTDPDGGTATIASAGQALHGSVSILDGGHALEYRPAAGYCNDVGAPDRFSYVLNGGSSATVDLTVLCLTQVFTDPGLFPAFDPNVSDYVIRCDGSPVQISGHTAQDESVVVDGLPSQTGELSATVPLGENQEFDFTLSGDEQRDYHARCLPSAFPNWDYAGFLPAHHAFYVVAPTLAFGGSASTYAVIFDERGAPIWWYRQAPAPVGAEVLPDGNIVWWRSGKDGVKAAFELRTLDGTLVESVHPASEGSTDLHEFQVEPNGNYLIITSRAREHVDLTAYGGGADDAVKDAEIEELKPGGELIWEWSTEGHIGLAETGRWWPFALRSATRDTVHMNAVEPDGEDAFLISLRHTDAVYKIDKATGDVIWKLGGTWTPKSLTVLNDPEGAYPLGGQHDVRLQPDGSITVHDNNTGLPDPPRAVRYEIDEANKTASLVEELTDPEVAVSACCGSARRSFDGSWLMNWGANSLVTEFNAAHERTFQLGFGGHAFSYRAFAVPDEVLSAAALRAGMNAMHPRP
jgi:hypothetical protein